MRHISYIIRWLIRFVRVLRVILPMHCVVSHMCVLYTGGTYISTAFCGAPDREHTQRRSTGPDLA